MRVIRNLFGRIEEFGDLEPGSHTEFHYLDSARRYNRNKKIKVIVREPEKPEKVYYTAPDDFPIPADEMVPDIIILSWTEIEEARAYAGRVVKAA